ncbi:DUF2147 domain-containing protein [Rhizobium sp. RAF56]|jgi:uncharacterized protein (DUF2147 family)|uniref:DUF2147 domain-containing protein n=1 Tax=Rhizobium sp. RAF56 TaxID=3233062 RepID=UPI003F9B9D61
MIRSIMLAGVVGCVFALGTGFARAEEPIVGTWKTAKGETAEIGLCGSAYCVTLKSGKFTGRQIGKMSGTGGSYTGELTDPEADKTYSGSGSVSGDALKLQGCVLKILCKSQTWTRL